jgi:hypothetical protein
MHCSNGLWTDAPLRPCDWINLGLEFSRLRWASFGEQERSLYSSVGFPCKAQLRWCEDPGRLRLPGLAGVRRSGALGQAGRSDMVEFRLPASSRVKLRLLERNCCLNLP